MKSIIYVNKFGVLKIGNESSDLLGEIPEETLEILD